MNAQVSTFDKFEKCCAQKHLQLNRKLIVPHFEDRLNSH